MGTVRRLVVGDGPEQRGLAAQRQQRAARGGQREGGGRAHVQHDAHVGARRVHGGVQREALRVHGEVGAALLLHRALHVHLHQRRRRHLVRQQPARRRQHLLHRRVQPGRDLPVVARWRTSHDHNYM